MNSKILKLLKGVLAWCALCGVLTAHAQDKATLDLLVSKGVITQAEADKAAKEAAVSGAVVPRMSTVQKIKIEGLLQAQYNDLYAHDSATHNLNGTSNVNPPSTNQMYFRRAQLGVSADLGNGWGGEIMADFAATQIADQPKVGLSPQSYPTVGSAVNGQQGVQYISQNLFEKIAITKQIDNYGTAEVGYDKTNFIQEELISSAALPALERSVATRYFDEYYGSPSAYRLAFAQRRTGVFWKGTLPNVTGLYYSAAFTNGIQSNINYTNAPGLEKFGAWFGTGYKNTVGDTGLTLDGGINFGYSGDGNSQTNTKTTATAPQAGSPVFNQNAQSNSTYGYNPYVKLAFNKFNLLAEFFQARFQNGRSTIPYTSTNLDSPGVTSAASPYGFNLIPTYNITDDWQAVARFSYLSTNGRGTDQNGILWNAPNDNASSVSATTGATTVGSYGPLFDDAYALYLGLNWSISPGVRLSAGYEEAKLVGRQTYTDTFGTSNFNGPSTTEGLVRVQLTVTF